MLKHDHAWEFINSVALRKGNTKRSSILEVYSTFPLSLDSTFQIISRPKILGSKAEDFRFQSEGSRSLRNKMVTWHEARVEVSVSLSSGKRLHMKSSLPSTTKADWEACFHSQAGINPKGSCHRLAFCQFNQVCRMLCMRILNIQLTFSIKLSPLIVSFVWVLPLCKQCSCVESKNSGRHKPRQTKRTSKGQEIVPRQNTNNDCFSYWLPSNKVE